MGLTSTDEALARRGVPKGRTRGAGFAVSKLPFEPDEQQLEVLNSEAKRGIELLAAMGQIDDGGGEGIAAGALAEGVLVLEGVAARVMRQILVDHARARHAKKRGAQFTFALNEHRTAGPQQADVLELDGRSGQTGQGRRAACRAH